MTISLWLRGAWLRGLGTSRIGTAVIWNEKFRQVGLCGLMLCLPSLSWAEGASSGVPLISGPKAVPLAEASIIPSMPKQRIVYHVNSNSHSVQYNALLNISNHLRAAGKDNLDVRMVLHGRGVSMLLKPEAAPSVLIGPAQLDEPIKRMLDDLRASGVQILVGEQTLKNAGLNYKTDLYKVSAENLVNNGVMELIRLQSYGYIYIKP